MKKTIQDAINAQINVELAAAYSYLGMAAYLDARNLSGAAQWMKKQAEEEIAHAMRFYGFVTDCDGRVILTALSAPKKEYTSLLQVFQTSLAQEQEVTKLIYGLYELAQKEKDYVFVSFLKWFLDEQLEEESTVRNYIQKIEHVGETGAALYLIDQELGKRE